MRYFPVYIAITLSFIACRREAGTEPVSDGLPPTIPAGLSVYYAFDGAIGLDWNLNPEPDVNSYIIYRAVNGENFVPHDTTSEPYFVDAPVDFQIKFRYKIKAVDISGTASGYSQTVEAICVNRYAPYAPRRVTANATNRDNIPYINLSWSPGEEYDLDYYNIYRSEIKNFEPDSSLLIASVENYFYTDTIGINILQEYYYRIVAVDKGGLISKPSSEVYDMALDSPVNIFPADSINTKRFNAFKVLTVSAGAVYKIAISESEIGGYYDEITFHSDAIREVIEVAVSDLRLRDYQKYYWQIFTYTSGNSVPNSYSEKTYFRIIP